MDCSLYIHIPFCLSKCAYCDFFSRPFDAVPDSYIQALCNEITYRLSEFKVDSLSTIYIGGGTPSLLSPAQFTRLFEHIRKSVRLAQKAEITVEVNPDDVNEALLKTLQACGVNRISCGIQSLNDKALKSACRRADTAMNLKALDCFKKHWKGQLSLDLIAGLPEEDEKSLLNGLEIICAQKPDHISLYSLTIEAETPLGKQLEEGKLTYDFDAADRLWLCGRDYLEKQGYFWYEVSNFCLPGKECRHNLGYWNHKNYLGCGAAACGSIYKEDGSGLRWTNNCDITEYTDFWLGRPKGQSAEIKRDCKLPQSTEIIDLATSQFEFFMMGLRKLSGVSQEEYKTLFGESFPETFTYLFNKWQERGLCHIREGRYALSREGMLFLNRFLEEL